MRKEADLAIEGGTIVTMDPKRRIIEDGLLLIEGESICYVGEPDIQWSASEVIDADAKTVMPGLVDAHGHAGHGLVKTLGDRPGGDWLQVAEAIYFRYSTENFWKTEAMLSALERVKFGVTSGYSMLGNIPRTDHPVWAVRHAEGTAQVGIRDFLGVGPGLPPWPKKVTSYDEDGHPRTASHTLRQALAVTRQICQMSADAELGSLTTVHVSPSRIGDPDGLGADRLRKQTEGVVSLAREFGLPINSHAYRGNIEYAHDHLDILGPKTLLAHCTGITPREVSILAETKTSVAHCPSARAVVRGWCPVNQLLREGVNVAIATDGSGPDRTFCLFKDMRHAAIIHRIHEGDESLLQPGRLLEMVTIDAARALGAGEQLGSLTEGNLADVIIINTHQPHQHPRSMPVYRLAYATSGQDVETVVVGGRVVMRDREVLTVDEEQVLTRAQKQYDEMLRRSPFDRELRKCKPGWSEPTCG